MRALTLTGCLTVVLAFSPLSAQEAPRGSGIRSNAVYVELLGNMGDYSANYERLVGGATVLRVAYGGALDSYGDCFGIGFISACEGEIDVTLAGLMVSRLIGQRHMREIGLGAAYGSLTETRHAPFVSGETTIEKETVSTLTATIGYRYQTGGRWLVRAGYTPSYGLSGQTANYSVRGFSSSVGASMGIAF